MPQHHEPRAGGQSPRPVENLRARANLTRAVPARGPTSSRPSPTRSAARCRGATRRRRARRSGGFSRAASVRGEGAARSRRRRNNTAVFSARCPNTAASPFRPRGGGGDVSISGGDLHDEDSTHSGPTATWRRASRGRATAIRPSGEALRPSRPRRRSARRAVARRRASHRARAGARRREGHLDAPQGAALRRRPAGGLKNKKADRAAWGQRVATSTTFLATATALKAKRMTAGGAARRAASRPRSLTVREESAGGVREGGVPRVDVGAEPEDAPPSRLEAAAAASGGAPDAGSERRRSKAPASSRAGGLRRAAGVIGDRRGARLPRERGEAAAIAPATALAARRPRSRARARKRIPNAPAKARRTMPNRRLEGRATSSAARRVGAITAVRAIRRGDAADGGTPATLRTRDAAEYADQRGDDGLAAWSSDDEKRDARDGTAARVPARRRSRATGTRPRTAQGGDAAFFRRRAAWSARAQVGVQVVPRRLPPGASRTPPPRGRLASRARAPPRRRAFLAPRPATRRAVRLKPSRWSRPRIRGGDGGVSRRPTSAAARWRRTSGDFGRT